jgi:PadR family transcriptional regulator, regulatory protein PadR
MKPDAVRGHVDAMLLGVLESGPLHGYAIIEAVARRSGGTLDLPAGTIYPALHRLERSGMLSSSWTTVGGRRRRSYALTDAGRGRLQTERAEWRQFSVTIGAVLGEAPA